MDMALAQKMAKDHFNMNDEQLAKVTEIHTTCDLLTDPDKCESVFKRMVCVHETAKKLGIHLPIEDL